MSIKFKKLFIAIWIFSALLFSSTIAFDYVNKTLLSIVDYVYVAALLFFIADSDLISDRINSKEKLIKLKGYDLGGLLLIIFIVTFIGLFIGLKTSVLLIMVIITLPGAIWIMIKYNKLITQSLIIKSIGIGLICGLAQYNYLLSLIAISALTPIYLIASFLLEIQFKFTTIHFNRSSAKNITKAFFTGSLLALPMALSNLNDVMTTQAYSWIDQLWEPLLTLSYVLLEETWVRLFLIGFIFSLLASKTNRKIIPLAIAILISAVVFGLSHYPQSDIKSCINISILYGLPLGLILYKKGFEAAVGYHFTVNFISAVSTYLINNQILLFE